MLAQCREVGVVVDEHRQVEPLGHHVGEHDVLEREVHGDDRGARPLIDYAGDAEADRGDLAAGAGARFLDRVDDGVEEVETSRRLMLRCARWWTDRPIDRAGKQLRTATSTPMVRRAGMPSL